MITLYGRRQTGITLADAIVACQQYFNDAVGLLYSPESCLLAKVEGIEIKDSSGTALNLGRVFEARIFNPNYELRWLNRQSGQGTAVLLSEQKMTGNLTERIDDLQAIDTQEQTYLLWGEGYSANVQPGWSQLATSRLGKLDVPFPGVNQSKQRIKLITKEYFRCMDELYSNVIVAEERLICFDKL
jgi:CRISPR-associated protein (TIGR03984 family)